MHEISRNKEILLRPVTKIDKKGQFSCFDGCSSEHYHLDLDHLSNLKMSNN